MPATPPSRAPRGHSMNMVSCSPAAALRGLAARVRGGSALLLLVAAAGCSSEQADPRRQQLRPGASMAELMRVADAERGRRLFGQCAACHTIGKGAPHRAGPNLFAIMGKPIAGASDRFGYTDALKVRKGRWTPETMSEWLRDPQQFAPGTQMVFPGVRDPLDRADIIAFLEKQSG